MLIPISTFGVFAIICVFFNYIFAVFITPGVAIVQYKYFLNQPCCCPKCCCGGCCQDDPTIQLVNMEPNPVVTLDSVKADDDATVKGDQQSAKVQPSQPNAASMKTDDDNKVEDSSDAGLDPNQMCFRRTLINYFTKIHYPLLSVQWRGVSVVAWAVVVIFIALVPPMLIEALSMEAPGTCVHCTEWLLSSDSLLG